MVGRVIFPPPAAADEAAALGGAAAICRGACRLMLQAGAVPLTEMTLPTGRRVDLMALDEDGALLAVEVKSSVADFRGDAKWPAYLAWADRFYFAVDPAFPAALLPADEGLIVADRHGGEIVRHGPLRPLPAARRRALTLRFARMAAARLLGRSDPDAGLDLTRI